MNPHTNIEGMPREFRFPMTTSGQAMAEKEIDMPGAIIPGMIYEYSTVLVSGAAKQGKSTMLRDLLRRMHDSFRTYSPVQSLVPTGNVKPVNTLVLSEENEWAWRAWLDELEGTPEDLQWIRFLTRADGNIAPASREELGSWCDQLIDIIQTFEIGCLVLDPVSRLLALQSENDNAEVISALMEVERIATKTGCAVVMLHHTTKGGNEPRGCSAWQQQPDILLNMRGLKEGESIAGDDGEYRPDRVRLIYGKGRMQEIESCIPCYCDENGRYEYLDGVEVARTGSTKADLDGESIMTHMRKHPSLEAFEAVQLARDLCMEIQACRRALRLLVGRNRVVKSGTTRNSTYTLRD